MSSAAAFAATEAIKAGEWDRHLAQIQMAVSDRLRVTDRTRTPNIPLPPGQVWVWMNDPVNEWQPRGTGVVFP